MPKIKIIGLTGQSGSGKSTVARLLSELNCAIINADELAHGVTKKGSHCLNLIKNYFGEEIITPDGELNRKALGKIVFSDKTKLELLNEITHPFILYEFICRVKEIQKSNFNYIVFDAPQLFESKADALCDIIIGVTAPYQLRLRRIAKRDNLSEDDIRKRFNSQFDEEYFTSHCDYTINNDGDIDKLKSIVLDILNLE